MNTLVKARVGRPTDTAKREKLLEALKGDPHEYFQIGVPPYAVGQLSERLEVDPSNLRKDLLKLEAEGFAVSEYHKVSTWNAISHRHMERKCLCFWNAATMEQDKATTKAWKDGAQGRSDDTFARMGL
jgi:hypothetical protein